MKIIALESFYPRQLFYMVVALGCWVLPFFISMPSWWAYVVIGIAALPLVYAALVDLMRGRLGSELFLSIATAITLWSGELSAIFVVLFIMLIARYCDLLITHRTSTALRHLIELVPTDVLVKQNGKEVQIPLEQVTPGMHLMVKSGKRIPVDGIIVEGEAAIHEAMLTGESVPREKGPGSLVFAGTYSETGTILIEVQAVGRETLYGKIRLLLEQAGKEKAQVVRYTDRIASLFTPIFLAGIGVVWLLTHNSTLIVTLLIFGSPLELTLVTPLTMLSAIAAAFKKGILVKNGAALEQLAATNVLIFDKTGTLTMGLPEVVSIKSLHNEYTQQDILRIAAIAEKKSGHILAKAILAEAAKQKIDVPDPERYTSLTGHGITVTYQGVTYLLGNRHFMEAAEHGNLIVPGCSDQAATTFYLARTDQLLGEICLADRIKPDAKYTIAALKKRGIQSMILLSGDTQAVAEYVAHQLGIDEAQGEVMPDKKLALIEKLQRDGSWVTMVGDGVNDAPALRQAQVGIALGGMGMEPAIQASDIVLMSSNLEQLLFLYDLSVATMRTIKQNLLLGFAMTHAVGIILAFGAYITPIQAALFHAVPDLLILLYGVRLINFEIKPQ